MVLNPSGRLLQVWGRCAFAVLTAVAVDAHADCRSASLSLSPPDMSLDLGEYGTLFREASQPECRAVVRVQLERKLRLALAAPPRFDVVLGRDAGTFERWLAGANIGLAIPAAMQAGVEPSLDRALRATIDAYRFNVDPACGTNLLNECMDDFTQAAVAYGWAAAYERAGDRPDRAAHFAREARGAIHLALARESHSCLTPVDALPQRCSDTYTDDVVSFNHGFQNVAYGIDLLTSISSAAIALEEAGFPYEASAEEAAIAWALFREGQRSTLADGTAFRSNCYRVAGSRLLSDAPCADADYQPRVFPVRVIYERLFHGAPNESPYRFDEFDASLFNTAFMNDGRYAVYVELGLRWWQLRPRLEGYRVERPRTRSVRH
jgi:hypothetical protein